MLPNTNVDNIVVPSGIGTGIVKFTDNEHRTHIMPLLTPTYTIRRTKFMRNYFNKYNVINFTVFIWIVSFVLERLSLFLFFQMNLESFYYFVVFIWILRLIIVSAFSVLLITIGIDFISRSADSDSFINGVSLSSY